jgi:hypothetical protein
MAQLKVKFVKVGRVDKMGQDNVIQLVHWVPTQLGDGLLKHRACWVLTSQGCQKPEAAGVCDIP